MNRLQQALVSVAAIAIAVSVVVTISVTPVASAADSALVEAESMTVAPTNGGSRASDSTASGSAALVLRSKSTASKTLSLPASASVVVRAKGQQCLGVAPSMDLSVDGTKISTTKVSATSWTDYTVTKSIPAGTHTIVVAYTNPYMAFFCTRSLSLDKVTVIAVATTTTTTTSTTTSTTPTTTSTTPTTTSTTPTTVTTTPTSNPAARVFNGDYSTNDFSQWPNAQHKGYNGSGAAYVPTTYSASIVSDAAKGPAARYEVRSGDVPPFGGGERSEVSGGAATGGTEGQTLWYAFSTKFDPTFPQNHATLGWGLTNQWHSDASTGSPPVGWYVDQRNGYWSLTIHKQSSPGTYLQTFSIFDVPLGTNWHDVKMQIKWSASDTVGFIRLWLNGTRQKFLDGSDTYYVRTLIPGTNSVYYKEGLYRAPMAPTDIVYHAGFRTAKDESGL